MSTFRRWYCSWPGTGDTLYLHLVTHTEKNNKYNWRKVLKSNGINVLFITDHFESEKDYQIPKSHQRFRLFFKHHFHSNLSKLSAF